MRVLGESPWTRRAPRRSVTLRTTCPTLKSVNRRGFLGGMIGASLVRGQTAASASLWNGYEKRDFTFQGHAAYVVLPRIAAPGKPWLWRARFPDYQPRPALGVLSKGFHLAYLDLPNIFGNPLAVAAWES